MVTQVTNGKNAMPAFGGRTTRSVTSRSAAIDQANGYGKGRLNKPRPARHLSRPRPRRLSRRTHFLVAS